MKKSPALLLAAIFAAFFARQVEASTLVNNGDGTVSDTRTGLTWQQADPGMTMNWETALAYCNSLTLSDTDDWRLPNVKELESITDDTKWPPMDTTYFPFNGYYWSSTTYLDRTVSSTKDHAWCVYAGPSHMSKTTPMHVRCVRTTCTFAVSPETDSFAVSGGTGTVNVSAFSQTCPWETVNNLDWVSVTSGPTGTGDGTVQFTVSPNSGAESRSGSLTIAGRSFTIAQAGVSPSPLAITTTSLPYGTVQTGYTRALSATGGRQPYTWAIIAGNLPPGLFLNAAFGKISGAPTATGSFDFTVQVTDADSATASKGLSLAIITITSLSNLPLAITEQPYSYTLTASGGTPPYTWSATSTLPLWMSLNNASGQLSGTPPKGRSSTQFKIRVADAESRIVEPYFYLQIYDPFAITTASLPDATAGVPYSCQTLTTTGGDTFTSPKWYISSGSLPPGLIISLTTGVISGTATTTGSFPVTIQAISSPFSTTKSFSIAVNAPCSSAKLARLPDTAYDSIASAYSAALDGDIIESINGDFTGDLAFSRDISVTLKGGYDCAYSSNNGLTRVQGTVTIGAGTLIVENLQME